MLFPIAKVDFIQMRLYSIRRTIPPYQGRMTPSVSTLMAPVVVKTPSLLRFSCSAISAYDWLWKIVLGPVIPRLSMPTEAHVLIDDTSYTGSLAAAAVNDRVLCEVYVRDARDTLAHARRMLDRMVLA